MRLRDLPIAVKLGAGFGVVIVLMVVIALVGLSKLSASNSNTEFLAKNSLPSITFIDSVDSAVEAYHGVAVEHVIAEDQAELDEMDGELKGPSTRPSGAIGP
jgi:methyl-accepting chemotaxis protein